MIKIAIIGGCAVWHSKSFAEMFNGYDEKMAKGNGYPLYKSRIENAIVTHVWDTNRDNAELLARICNVENVVTNMEDVLGKVDGVIIADDLTMQHQKRAPVFIEAGLPTFIDKPFSPDIDEVVNTIEFAKKHNTPIMSCSALRYAKEVEEFLSQKEGIGEILTANTVCKGDLLFYGIHAFEQLYTVIGPGIKSVLNIGLPGKDIVIITKNDGRKFVLTVYEDIGYLFQMTLYGKNGWQEIVVQDSDYFYSNMLKKFTGMVETREMPFPPEETLEIIRTLVLAKKSATDNKEIQLY